MLLILQNKVHIQLWLHVYIHLFEIHVPRLIDWLIKCMLNLSYYSTY